MAEEEDEKASGDSISRKSEEEPVPPKVPDVELIVDGFGFMPSTAPGHSLKSSNYFTAKSSKSVKSEEHAPDRSPCSSSTNIDIVRRYTWKTKNRMTVQVITYGATLTSIQVPDKKGVPDDVIAGFDSLEEYLQPNNPYFGATIGRYANVIQDGTIIVRPSGRMYKLCANKGYHHYNGGRIGFDKVNWRAYVNGNKVIMSHVSARFHEGYPGEVMAQVTFEVTCDNTIKIEMKCTTSEPTAINLSNSPYFNLAGHHSGCETMLDHIFTINADKYTVADAEGVVTGEKKVVGGTAYDFRVPRVLRTMIPKMPFGGYNVNFCVTQGIDQDLTFQARALHPTTGRVLEVYSNQPGVQFYTGNHLPDPDKIIEGMPGEKAEERSEEESKEGSKGESEEGSKVESKEESKEEDSEESGSEGSSENSIHPEEEESGEGKKGYGYVPLVGKSGTFYKKHGLFCLLPQNYPDAINHQNFPNSVLNPGEVYVHRIQYKFGLLLGRYV